jgi:hypothetical protein
MYLPTFFQITYSIMIPAHRAAKCTQNMQGGAPSCRREVAENMRARG